jgi:PPOX class probable F420-dependent enzyme
MGQDVVATQGATSGEHFPNEKYISIETFHHSGTPVATPVWFVGLVYVGTFPKTGKVKRLRTNQRGRVAACTFRGHVKGEWREGEAHILDAGAEAD